MGILGQGFPSGLLNSMTVCVCQLFSPSSFEMWTLEAEYEDWKLLFKLGLRFDGPQFATPVWALGGSTSNGYVFVRVRDGGGLKIMLVDTNQEPLHVTLSQKRWSLMSLVLLQVICPHCGRQCIGV